MTGWHWSAYASGLTISGVSLRSLFGAKAFEPKQARIVADVLVWANWRGVDAHAFMFECLASLVADSPIMAQALLGEGAGRR